MTKRRITIMQDLDSQIVTRLDADPELKPLLAILKGLKEESTTNKRLLLKAQLDYGTLIKHP